MSVQGRSKAALTRKGTSALALKADLKRRSRHVAYVARLGHRRLAPESRFYPQETDIIGASAMCEANWKSTSFYRRGNWHSIAFGKGG